MLLEKEQIKSLENITQLYAISGQENEVAKYLISCFKKQKLEIITDNLGSVFAIKKSKIVDAPKIMICGHMDEVGFLVIKINPTGLLTCTPIGGISQYSLQAHRVSLKTKRGKYIHGTISAIPPHLLDDKSKNINIEDLSFDFGFTSDKEALKAGVYPGAMIVLDGGFEILNGGKRLLSKAFDDRYGIALIVDMLKEIQNKEFPFDLYLGGTVQEEVGLRGAVTASNSIGPDIAIVLDCSPARDSNGTTDDWGKLGEGVLIRYFDKSMIAFPELLAFQIDACKQTNSKYQYFDSPGSTDAGAIHKNHTGVLTLTHCICARGIHSPSSIIDIEDYLAAKRSLIYMLDHLDKKQIDEFKKERE